MGNNLALFYANLDGIILDRVAELTVEKAGLRIGVYAKYDQSEVSSLIPTEIGDVPFWRNPRKYESDLFHRYSVKGLPFKEGTLLVRGRTTNIQPASTEQRYVTKLPPQEEPADRSGRIPSKFIRSRYPRS